MQEHRQTHSSRVRRKHSSRHKPAHVRHKHRHSRQNIVPERELPKEIEERAVQVGYLRLDFLMLDAKKRWLEMA